MSHLNLLLKVLYKPREAFEELQGTITWKDGIFVTVFSIFMALLAYGSIARILGSKIIPFGFGAGKELSAIGVGLGLFSTFAFLIGGAWVANKIALKLGGTGNFSETLGMFGYGKVIYLFQSATAVVMMGFVLLKTNEIIKLAQTGATTGLAEVFGNLGSVFVVVSGIFLVWNIWIQTSAVSVGHKLGFTKSLFAVVTSLIILGTVLSLMP